MNYHNTTETFKSLILRVETDIELAERHGSVFVGVKVAEYADGSRRMFALIDYMRQDEEYQVRIVAPASQSAPRWAEKFIDYETTEITARNTNLSLAW